MHSFSKFIVFVCIIMLMPLIVNIVDNFLKIFNIYNEKNMVGDKLVDFNKDEFIRFILEFFERKYKSTYVLKNDNEIYLKDEEVEKFLYYDNHGCGEFTLSDILKLIGVCESKGITDIFIFTTKFLDSKVLDYIKDISDTYSIDYIHGKDLNLNYNDFVYKFYSI